MALFDDVRNVVRETRSSLLPAWGTAPVVSQKSASASDVVTALDTEIELFLKQRLAALDSSITFAGEEFGGSREEKRFWLCDPIDGTAMFVRGLPFCTVMLALIEDGQVVFSVIYDFVRDEMFHAERGLGAFKNGEAIHVSERGLGDAYVGYETHHDHEKNADTFMKLRKILPLFKSMNAGWEFAQVAQGKLEGRVCFDPWGKDYDFAPGSLLVEEAGGVVANLGLRTYDFKNTDFIAANSMIFNSLTLGKDAVFPIAS
jgi:myo-inositol-1(or 4)-monophosphatase